MNKLNLDFSIVESARKIAKNIASDTQKFIDKHSTTSIERTICRLLGIDGVDEFGVPLPNVVVDHIHNAGLLNNGIALYLGNTILHINKSPQNIAEKISQEQLDMTEFPLDNIYAIKEVLSSIIQKNLDKIKRNRQDREELISRYGEKSEPLIYLIVATGNIFEDMVQAQAAARQGADVIAVIRSTGQSLLDYVPYGSTTEGFGGTYATQENFRLMRSALDEVSKEEGRYVRLTNYCSGLCMPEIAAIGAFERLDMMLNDALYGILFRDINMQRTIIDQYFSRMINAYAGVIINTGEDNYLTTDDAYEAAHTVLASQFINEQFAKLAGLNEEQMGLGHAFEMNPELENGFVYELAQAQMAREIFPNAPLKYMPPTKYMTGNIFKGHVQDALFNIITILTNQRIHLLGMLTEALHTPFMSDRALSIENARYIFQNMKNLGDEIMFKKGGIIQQRASEVLNRALELLTKIEKEGLFRTIEKGIFAQIKRPIDGGKGLDGVIPKSKDYFNPFLEIMSKELNIGGEK
ncbi:MAG: lysine 5,6-aminomutase subunit alpha [Candidatus Lokiarchaeota archaeon]|nr:lysine 5,6-aminomutase subunit alpha [Candidatus Lokiarchaeota archaeon]